jgi:hypothetical protein
MRGADVAAVQRILRHSDPRLTMETYGHLVPDYLRTQIDLPSFGPIPWSAAAAASNDLASHRQHSGSVCSYFARSLKT